MKSVESRYVYQVKPNWFTVRKYLNGESVYFGGFTKLKDALRHRDYCVKHGWTLDCVKSKRDDTMRYISQLPSGKYVIYKSLRFNGTHKSVYFGLFDTLEEAMKHRDYCIQYDWDLDKCKVKRINKHFLPTHITKGRSGYLLQKKFYDGRDSYHQWFKNLNDAIHEKELLCKCNWDIEELIALDECERTL